MHHAVRPIVLTILMGLASATLFSVEAGAGTAPPVLDHFKCYRIDPPTTFTMGVTLRDQFDQQAAPARLTAPERFCNPVRKDHQGVITPIAHPNDHLKVYRMVSEQESFKRRVIVRNQFGRQALTTTRALWLAVPTQKLPHEPPKDTDHFKCYKAGGPSVEAPIRITDQYSLQPATVLRPVAFCNPTVKRHNDVVTPIVNAKLHLTCYQIQTPAIDPRSVTAINQFGTEQFRVSIADWLCVPSEKLRFKVVAPL